MVLLEAAPSQAASQHLFRYEEAVALASILVELEP
jgi:hypothetical protein